MESVKEVFEVLGYKGEATNEGLVSWLNQNWIPLAKALNDEKLTEHHSGRIFGLQNSLLSKLSGGKFTKEALKDMGWEKALEAVVGDYQTQLNAVKENAEKGEPKRVLELEKQLEEHKKSIADYERDKAALAKRLEEVETSADQKVQSVTMEVQRRDEFAKLPWIEKRTAAQMAGFNSLLKDNYREVLDENGKITIKDKDGHTIPNPKKPHETLSYVEVIEQLARENDLLKANDAKPDDKTKTKKLEPVEQKGSLRTPLQALG